MSEGREDCYILSDHEDDDLEKFIFGGHQYTANHRYTDHV